MRIAQGACMGYGSHQDHVKPRGCACRIAGKVCAEVGSSDGVEEGMVLRRQGCEQTKLFIVRLCCRYAACMGLC